MVRLLRLFVLVVAAALIGSPLAFGAIQIVKIQYNSPGRDSGSRKSLNGEWVQIRNTGKKPVSLKGWTLRDTAKHVYTFGKFTLGPGKWVKVHTGKGKDKKKHLYWDAGGHVWNNDKDTATLKKRNGKKADRCAYRSSSASTKVCKKNAGGNVGGYP